MNKNATYALAAVIVLLIAAGSFYGGMLYGKSKSGRPGGAFSGQMPAGMQAGQGNRAGNKQGQGFVNGEIIAKDDKSITIKSINGGSKIVLLAESTQISKSASGTASDLVSGRKVMINGKTNTDGSITATYVTLQPDQGNMPSSPNQTAPAQTTDQTQE